MNIIIWIISGILWSIANSYRKKAIDNSNLKNSSYTIIAVFFWLIFVFLFVFIVWESLEIFLDIKTIIIVSIISLVQVITNFMYINVYKKVKISELLPYENVGSLITIILGFFIFYWTENETSLTTFFIILLTIFTIIAFNFNSKKVKFSKDIWLYILALTLDAFVILTLWYLLLSYSSLSYMTLTIFIDFLLYLFLIIMTKESLKLIFKQNNIFYKTRFLSIIFWRISFFIWLYIIESSWVLIAILIGFLWLVFSILSMKFILWDTPNRKQVILAFIVTIMIWIWYYFN